MKRMSFWDVLAWIALLIIIVWLEYVPIYTAVYIAGWAMHKLDSVADDVKDLKKFKDGTITEINSIKVNCIKNHSNKKQ